MENILLYLGLAIAGTLAGGLVNFVVDLLYLYRDEEREVFDDDFRDELKAKGWIKYLVWPFSFETGKRRFKIRSILVVLSLMTAVVLLGFSQSDRVQIWWGIPVLIYFTIVIVMDVEFKIVMHPISIAGAIIGFIVGVYLRGFMVTLLGGAVGFVVMLLLFKFGELFMRIVNRKRSDEDAVDEVALGFGDVNLAGVVGLFLGWPPIILGLLFAVVIGGLVSIFLIFFSLFRKGFQQFMAMPYAPFLAIAALVMLFFPDQIAEFLGV
jgi:leader peptidase (prepilin peptidase)/N-methyltransferase